MDLRDDWFKFRSAWRITVCLSPCEINCFIVLVANAEL